MWLVMVVNSELQFSADPNKPIFAGEKAGCLFVSGQGKYFLSFLEGTVPPAQ